MSTRQCLEGARTEREMAEYSPEKNQWTIVSTRQYLGGSRTEREMVESSHIEVRQREAMHEQYCKQERDTIKEEKAIITK